MKNRSGYLAITIGWLAGLVAGSLTGYFGTRGLRELPNKGWDLIGEMIITLVVIVFLAVLCGFIGSWVALMAGDYDHLLATLLWLGLLVAVTLGISSLLGFTIMLLPFTALAARYLALHVLRHNNQ